MYILGDSILHTILINGGLVDDNDLQELIAVYVHREIKFCWRKCMDKILVMDEHNYDENLNEIYRISVRGIIFVAGKLLMIESSSGETKLPGGGMEPGEDDYQVLLREVKEETGYDVIPESIKPFGEIEEKRLSVHEPKIWHQINRLYFCDIYPGQGQCKYSENEKKEGFHPVLYTIGEALEKNERMLEKEGLQAWNQREYKTLLLIKNHLDGK